MVLSAQAFLASDGGVLGYYPIPSFAVSDSIDAPQVHQPRHKFNRVTSVSSSTRLSIKKTGFVFCPQCPAEEAEGVTDEPMPECIAKGRLCAAGELPAARSFVRNIDIAQSKKLEAVNDSLEKFERRVCEFKIAEVLQLSPSTNSRNLSTARPARVLPPGLMCTSLELKLVVRIQEMRPIMPGTRIPGR